MQFGLLAIVIIIMRIILPCVYDSAFPKHLCSLWQPRYQQLGTLGGGMLESSCCPDVGIAPVTSTPEPLFGFGRRHTCLPK